MIELIVGTTGSGKTTKALADAAKESRSKSRPVFLLDSEGVTDPKDSFATAPTVPEAIRMYWEDGRHTRYHPAGRPEVDALARAWRAAGHAIVLVDEGAYWFRYDQKSEAIERMIRVHRHSDLSLYITTQHVSDFSPLLLQCADVVHVFCTTANRSIERLVREYGFDEAEISSLKVGEFRSWEKSL